MEVSEHSGSIGDLLCCQWCPASDRPISSPNRSRRAEILVSSQESKPKSGAPMDRTATPAAIDQSRRGGLNSARRDELTRIGGGGPPEAICRPISIIGPRPAHRPQASAWPLATTADKGIATDPTEPTRDMGAGRRRSTAPCSCHCVVRGGGDGTTGQPAASSSSVGSVRARDVRLRRAGCWSWHWPMAVAACIASGSNQAPKSSF